LPVSIGLHAYWLPYYTVRLLEALAFTEGLGLDLGLESYALWCDFLEQLSVNLLQMTINHFITVHTPKMAFGHIHSSAGLFSLQITTPANDVRPRCLDLGLKAHVIGLSLAARGLGLGLVVPGLSLAPCGLVNITACARKVIEGQNGEITLQRNNRIRYVEGYNQEQMTTLVYKFEQVTAKTRAKAREATVATLLCCCVVEIIIKVVALVAQGR